MNPLLEAAIVAGAVSLITVIATVWTTNKGTNRTLAEQRTRTLNERFATAADKLGSDTPAIRLAGVYAMAGLADDWEENQQTCIDVLCACLRLPYKPDPGPSASADERRAFQGDREVRYTIMRVITQHLRDAGVRKQAAPVTWKGRNFNFSGVVFDGGSFSYARFSGGTVDFGRAEFRTSDKVNFHHVNFSGGAVEFRHTRFSDGSVEFDGAKFSGGIVSFYDAEFCGAKVSFPGAKFCGANVSFPYARFLSGTVDFSKAADSSHRPTFDWKGQPPPAVEVPAAWR